jgi:hypothetical protein
MTAEHGAPLQATEPSAVAAHNLFIIIPRNQRPVTRRTRGRSPLNDPHSKQRIILFHLLKKLYPRANGIQAKVKQLIVEEGWREKKRKITRRAREGVGGGIADSSYRGVSRASSGVGL